MDDFVEARRGPLLQLKKETCYAASIAPPGLPAALRRPDLVGHTRQLAERIAVRVKICLKQARLKSGDIDAVFLTGGSVRLAHVRKAITKAGAVGANSRRRHLGAVGKRLTLEALRRYGPRE